MTKQKYFYTAITALLFAFALTACAAPKTKLQEATGVTAAQAQAIEDILSEAGISYTIINEARHNRPETALPEGCTVYNLIDAEAMNYFLVLDENGEAVLLLDNGESIVWE